MFKFIWIVVILGLGMQLTICCILITKYTCDYIIYVRCCVGMLTAAHRADTEACSSLHGPYCPQVNNLQRPTIHPFKTNRAQV